MFANGTFVRPARAVHGGLRLSVSLLPDRRDFCADIRPRPEYVGFAERRRLRLLGDKRKAFISDAVAKLDLANAAGLGISTIRKLEMGHISPRGATMLGVQHAFEANGLEFIEPNGIRYRSDDTTPQQKTEGMLTFFDDVNKTKTVLFVKVMKIDT